MNELAQAIIAESYAAAPSHILEGLTDELVHRELPNVPHTIYAELWHMTFWQQMTLDWIAGVETPYPTTPSEGFPEKLHSESWEQLRQRFLQGADHAAAAAQDITRLDYPSAARPVPALSPAPCPYAINSSRSPPTTPTTSAASSYFASSSTPGPRLQAVSPGRRKPLQSRLVRLPAKVLLQSLVKHSLRRSLHLAK